MIDILQYFNTILEYQKLKPGFLVEAHVSITDATLLHASAMFSNFRGYSPLAFCGEFMTIGQVLPRASGKTTTLAKIAQLLNQKGWEITTSCCNKDIIVCTKGIHTVILQSDMGLKVNLTKNFRGKRFEIPPLRVVFYTPVI